MATAALLIAGILCNPAAADTAEQSGGRQVWAGADVSSDVWLVYSGVTVAPWSSIYEDGIRVRAAGGYGGYKQSYTQHSIDLTTDADRFTQRELDVSTYYGEVLIGYLKRYGELTAKAFVGASIISHNLGMAEEVIAIGDEVGIKGALELWLNIGERGWGSLDLWWSSAHDTRAARARVGYRVWPNLSIGLEGGINVDARAECRLSGKRSRECGHVIVSDDGTVVRDFDSAELLDYARGGTFARYEWGVSEVSVSVGALRNAFADNEVAPYVTLNWLTQF
ncbi:cellulose biosynthesis protein BcsS [Hyphomicrobium sp. CS1GBMeth3]|uniref:cellulose biosynthesis protein BcsS n=1 Tax=Hyphomicrobium sp. CS1GBMeth3 TaxID=1892845 RepID=UPI000931B342|nr:cellulose biosynthesis protein BcsS [Hyphomicrobium sp. CS1GBMeth3]